MFAINESVSIAMIWINPGTFNMGCPEEELEHDGKVSSHKVTLSRGYWLGETEVTQAQWQAVMNEEFWTSRPWADREFVMEGPNYPAVYVSWQDVQEFIQRLRNKIGQNIRLPTEAEWEYACQAGHENQVEPGMTLGDLKEIAWYEETAGKAGFAMPVASKAANAWGLYDMNGNVWEWCQDGFGDLEIADQKDPVVGFTGVGRVIRGGYFGSSASECLAAARKSYSPKHSFSGLGLRLVMD